MEIAFFLFSCCLLIFVFRKTKVIVCEVDRKDFPLYPKLQMVYAKDFWQKRIGLLNHMSLEENRGIFFDSVRSIHTIGMPFEFDMIFLDRHFCITALVESVKINQQKIVGPSSTKHVLEVGQGTISGHRFRVGDRLIVKV